MPAQCLARCCSAIVELPEKGPLVKGRVNKSDMLELIDALCHVVSSHPTNAALKSALREHLGAFAKLEVRRASPDARDWSIAKKQAAALEDQLVFEVLDSTTERLLTRFRRQLARLVRLRPGSHLPNRP